MNEKIFQEVPLAYSAAKWSHPRSQVSQKISQLRGIYVHGDTRYANLEEEKIIYQIWQEICHISVFKNIYAVFSCPADSSIGDLVTHSLTEWVREFFKNTTTEWPWRLVTLEIFDQGDEETWPDQKNTITKTNTKTNTMTKTNTFRELHQRATPYPKKRQWQRQIRRQRQWQRQIHLESSTKEHP